MEFLQKQKKNDSDLDNFQVLYTFDCQYWPL